MSGHFRQMLPVASHFPDRPQFSGFMKPCRFEGEVQDLEVHGKIPKEIDGVFYRVMPDPQYAPFIENDPWFNGDGNVSAFRVHNGKVHYKQRYVRTEKFVKERQAGRALLGKYRNEYTDAVEFKVRSTANTNVCYFNGKLLVMKEDAHPWTLNAKTLDTVRLEDFNGQLPSTTFTAHPKVDPKSGEMIGFGYEAKGDGTPDVCYFNISPDGKFTEIVWTVCPVVAMIHDFGVTENWVVFAVIPLTVDVERMKAGGEHFQWDADVPFYLGVLPRRGAKGEDVKWFRAPNAFPGHTANAYENDEGHIVMDLPICEQNVFFWWPDAQGNAPDPRSICSNMTRYIIDPHSSNLDLQPAEQLLKMDCEFPRIDERFAMTKHRHVFFDHFDPSLGTDMARLAPVMGGGHPVYNGIGHLDLATRKLVQYFPGPTHLVQEPVFLPRSDTAEEGDGWVMFLVNNYATMSSELHILDTKDFTKAQAVVLLPVRLRHGLHGNFVTAQELELMN